MRGGGETRPIVVALAAAAARDEAILHGVALASDLARDEGILHARFRVVATRSVLVCVQFWSVFEHRVVLVHFWVAASAAAMVRAFWVMRSACSAAFTIRASPKSAVFMMHGRMREQHGPRRSRESPVQGRLRVDRVGKRTARRAAHSGKVALAAKTAPMTHCLVTVMMMSLLVVMAMTR